MIVKLMNPKKGQPKLLSTMIKTSSLCAIIIPLIVVLVFFYIIMRNVILNDINKDLTSFVNQSSSDLISSFEQIENTYYTLISDPIINTDLYQSMTKFPVNPKLKHEDINDRLLKITYYSTSWNQKLLESVLICYSKTDYNYISNIFSIQNVYIPDSKELSGIMEYWDLFDKNIKSNIRIKMILPPKPNADLLYYVRDYYEIYQHRFKGLVVLGISEKALSKKYQSILKYKGAIGVLYLKDGTILSSTDPKAVGRKINAVKYGNTHFSQIIKDKHNFIIDITSIHKFDLTSAIIIPKKPIYQVLVKKMLLYVPLSAALILIFVIVGIVLSKNVIKYINTLIFRMENIRNGNYDTSMPAYGIVELDKLSSIFNNMSTRINYLINEVYEKQLCIRDAELRALQAQINPHFLFNILLCIGWKAKADKNEEIFTMINALSELLNSHIGTGANEKYTISKELQNVQYYLYLQKARFGDKLSFDLSDFDEGILSLYIPKLTLQPLVENAVVHGIEKKAGQGFIRLQGHLEGTHVAIFISDNGIGFDINCLNFEEEKRNGTEDQYPSHHIGIMNTDKRIKNMYGNSYGLKIESSIGIGTKVTITLPIDRGDGNVQYHHR